MRGVPGWAGCPGFRQNQCPQVFSPMQEVLASGINRSEATGHPVGRQLASTLAADLPCLRNLCQCGVARALLKGLMVGDGFGQEGPAYTRLLLRSWGPRLQGRRGWLGEKIFAQSSSRGSTVQKPQGTARCWCYQVSKRVRSMSCRQTPTLCFLHRSNP